VIGILLAWIARQPDPAPLRRGLWFGLLAGLGLAVALGFATFAAQSQLQGETLEAFQVGMALFAAALIVQMVIWMRRHGRRMKQQLEDHAARASGAIGIGAITALAVAREGTETVVFLYGLGLGTDGTALPGVAIAAAAGFALAAASGWIIARSARFLSYRVLFRISEILLLLIAGSLLAAGIDRMTGMDWLPPPLDPALINPVWDSSVLLDDRRGAGKILADFLGYRARPSGILLIAYAVFWTLALGGLAYLGRAPQHVPAAKAR
ncbi:MAG: FTR1 family iron permease, partial [Betaproteobacteria bacterium RBG_16_56_24]